MKKLLLIICAFLALNANAQYKNYKDSTYTMPFNLLSSPVSVNNGAWWDDTDLVVNLGFYFRFFKDSVNQVTVSGSGAMVSTTPDPFNKPFFNAIIAHGSDLQDKDTSGNGSFSPISYLMTGTAPNRIGKIEWKNAGFYNPIDNGNLADSIDFQLWLYETSDIIEVHYGNSNLVSPFADLYDGGPGAWFGIFDSLDINSPNFDCRKAYNLSGNISNPQLDSATNLNFLSPPGVTGNPTAGSVFRFIPKPKINGGGVGYDIFTKTESYNIDYYNNQNELRIDIFNGDDFQFVLSDLNGRIIEKGPLSKGRKLIHTDHYSKGIYVLKLYSKSENTSFKFVK
jgi:hypothetical protein